MSESDGNARFRPELPEAVRRLAARADELHAGAYAQGGGEDALGGGAGDEPAGPAPGAEGEGAPLTPAPLSNGRDPAAAEGPAPASDPVDWQHRFNSLKGKHDQVLGRVAALESLLASMQAAPPAPPAGPGAPPATTVVPPSDLTFQPLTDEEVTDFGDFVSVAERAAAAKLFPVIQELRAQVAELKGQVGHVTTRVETDAKAEAMAYLAEQVPDFGTLNEDPEFLAWLRQVDPFSMQQRQVLLNQAVAANNGPSIAAFFLAYKDSIGAARDPRTTPPPNPAPRAKSPAPGRTSLETLAGPGRGRPGTSPSGPPGNAGDAPVFRQSEIAAFYADVRRGVFKGREAEKNRIETQIIEASTAGRVFAG